MEGPIDGLVYVYYVASLVYVYYVASLVSCMQHDRYWGCDCFCKLTQKYLLMVCFFKLEGLFGGYVSKSHAIKGLWIEPDGACFVRGIVSESFMYIAMNTVC